MACPVEGNGVGYSSVVGGGQRSTVLHWSRNDGLVEPGGVLLMDMGVENTFGYTADVTRVLPVSGGFSAAQREVLDIVHASRDAGLALIAPGVGFRDIHHACMRVLAEGLHHLGLLHQGSVDEALDADNLYYRRWTLHGFGHMLGLDVHDCGRASAKCCATDQLREGYALTMEPGLYFQPDDELVPAELRRDRRTHRGRPGRHPSRASRAVLGAADPGGRRRVLARQATERRPPGARDGREPSPDFSAAWAGLAVSRSALHEQFRALGREVGLFEPVALEVVQLEGRSVEPDRLPSSPTDRLVVALLVCNSSRSIARGVDGPEAAGRCRRRRAARGHP